VQLHIVDRGFASSDMTMGPSLRANGSRECAPDDRLREAIHHAARSGMDCFVAIAPLPKRFAFVARNDGIVSLPGKSPKPVQPFA
jgi:hypothetical protein